MNGRSAPTRGRRPSGARPRLRAGRRCSAPSPGRSAPARRVCCRDWPGSEPPSRLRPLRRGLPLGASRLVRSSGSREPRTVDLSHADDRLYFRQLLAGRDFAGDDPLARQMVNFVYLIGDRQTAARPSSSTRPTTSASCSTSPRPTACALVGALATHYHPDHIGGEHDGLRHRGRARAARR